MEGDFLFSLEDQVALVGPDTSGSVQLDIIHMPLYTSCLVIERERNDSILRGKALPTHTTLFCRSSNPHHGRPLIYHNSRPERNMGYGWHRSFPPN
jgi:hypothetical protein